MNGQQRTYDGNLTLPVTLTLLQWQQIINLLQDMQAPWKVTNPLINELGRQIEIALQGMPTVEQRTGPSA